jgi:hypothetical protein
MFKTETQPFSGIYILYKSHSGAYPHFVGPEAYTISGALFNKKNKKLSTKLNIYLKMRKEIRINYEFQKA